MVVSEAQKLVKRFGAGIAPTPFARGAHHQVIVLRERNFHALAVDLRRGSDDNPLLLLGGSRKHNLGSVDVGLNGAHRTVHNEPHAHRCREMKDNIAAVDQFRHQRFIKDRVYGVAESRMCLQMSNVLK